MKMKSIFNKKILIAIATISSLSLQSCLDDDDNYAMRFPNALVTVKTMQSRPSSCNWMTRPLCCLST